MLTIIAIAVVIAGAYWLWQSGYLDGMDSGEK